MLFSATPRCLMEVPKEGCHTGAAPAIQPSAPLQPAASLHAHRRTTSVTPQCPHLGPHSTKPSVTESSGQDMDPADPNSIHQALNTQGTLVGRHKQMLQGLMKSLQTLTSSISQIGHQVNLLISQPPASSLTTPAARWTERLAGGFPPLELLMYTHLQQLGNQHLLISPALHATCCQMISSVRCVTTCDPAPPVTPFPATLLSAPLQQTPLPCAHRSTYTPHSPPAPATSPPPTSRTGTHACPAHYPHLQ
ncbi:uncharacterized protein [Pagrus major]|uniref:uncharacterized protein n=1 Tax=Pagrus major TaxID=143350 RepID=UPI003CC8CEDD